MCHATSEFLVWWKRRADSAELKVVICKDNGVGSNSKQMCGETVPSPNPNVTPMAQTWVECTSAGEPTWPHHPSPCATVKTNDRDQQTPPDPVKSIPSPNHWVTPWTYHLAPCLSWGGCTNNLCVVFTCSQKSRKRSITSSNTGGGNSRFCFVCCDVSPLCYFKCKFSKAHLLFANLLFANLPDVASCGIKKTLQTRLVSPHGGNVFKTFTFSNGFVQCWSGAFN